MQINLYLSSYDKYDYSVLDDYDCLKCLND